MSKRMQEGSMPGMSGSPAGLDPMYEILGVTGQNPAEALADWSRLFVTHDRLMFKAFEREAGEEKAFRMHRRVWENPTNPILAILQKPRTTVVDSVAAFVKAFMAHDYYSFWVMVEELGEVKAIEAHHSIWEHQDEEAGQHGVMALGKEGLTWEELLELYQRSTHNEGIPFFAVEVEPDHLVVETKHCSYFETMCTIFGKDKAEELCHKIAVESTDRTIEGFLAGVGQQDKVQGVMVKHMCQGDEVCQVVFTRRTSSGLPSHAWGDQGQDRNYLQEKRADK